MRRLAATDGTSNLRNAEPTEAQTHPDDAHLPPSRVYKHTRDLRSAEATSEQEVSGWTGNGNRDWSSGNGCWCPTVLQDDVDATKITHRQRHHVSAPSTVPEDETP